MKLTRLWTSFAQQVDARPDATALVAKGGHVSYGELADLVADASHRLDRLGTTGGEPVGVPATKTPRTIALVLACLRRGVPVVLPSPTLPAASMQRLLDRAGCRHVIHADDGGSAPAGAAPAPATPHGPDDIAFVLTTSGSTGLPKLVPLSAGAVERFADWAAVQFDLGPGAATLNYAPLNFDLCFLDVWATLHHGGTVVLVDPAAATNGRHLLDAIDDNAVTVVQTVPMTYQLLVDAAGDAGRKLPSVRHAMFTGDHMPTRYLARLPEVFPDSRFYNIYGCTETNDSFLHEVDRNAIPADGVPLGTPLPGVEAVVLDDAGAVVTGPGRGELIVATPFQAARYLGADPQAPNPFVDAPVGRPPGSAARFYRTGDIVRRDGDGLLRLEGRNDHQVKVRGTRVNTSAVEQVLLDHDEVAEAVVIAVPDPVAGHVLHAVLRRVPGAAVGALGLRQHCAQHLPTAAIPSTLRLSEAPLPRTSTGKVDRQSLGPIQRPPHSGAAATRKESIR
ncbi:carbohydrate-binding protein [Streptomyces sp. WZ.A104]|uniref:AMP-binding protein n=1 Tax=Streptomyces sp. WZ.A104 TaxID=2023771 RepID=UPI000BBBAED5|nr:AMP-binding protein [Streptomyces sp. WZ.A104]PCG82045.1 carbohydrate-binding protein [Streptomyces sp. WZ.A104]